MTTEASVDAVLREKRACHPELRRPLDWPGVQEVCAREGVRITHGPLPADAVLLAAHGTAVIVLNNELHPRRHTYRVAHELGHWWLHTAPGRTVYQMRDPLAHDQREDEAEYVALRLMQGW